MTGRLSAVVLVVATVLAGRVPIAVRASADAPDQERVEAGRRLYERHKCATCHQIDGRGNGRFPLDGVAVRLASEDLRRWLTDTARMEAAQPKLPAIRMSAMKYRFSPEDVAALVDYLGTLK
jgi:mono/diheme cytochrome c family protein